MNRTIIFQFLHIEKKSIEVVLVDDDDDAPKICRLNLLSTSLRLNFGKIKSKKTLQKSLEAQLLIKNWLLAPLIANEDKRQTYERTQPTDNLEFTTPMDERV